MHYSNLRPLLRSLSYHGSRRWSPPRVSRCETQCPPVQRLGASWFWPSCGDKLHAPALSRGQEVGALQRQKTSIGEVGMRDHTGAAVLAVLLVAGTAMAAYAEIAVSANDAKVKLVNGKVEVQKSPPADT